MITIYAHIEGLETTVMEIEELPKPTDTLIVGKNPRRRDGKDAPFMLPEANTLVLPLSRIVFIEIMGGEEEEEVVTFIRE